MRRACLDDWEKAATFFENGAKIAQGIEATEEYIGLYADAGFTQFKAGNMLESIKLLNLALQKFEMLPQDNVDLKYVTLKNRLAGTISWIAGHETENNFSDFSELPISFCSDPETDENNLNVPDFPMGYSWLYLAQIEYEFGHGTTAFRQSLRIADREIYPILDYSLSRLETQYDFRNKTFENLPQRMYRLAHTHASMEKHNQSEKGIGERGTYSISITDLSNFASVRKITVMLTAALLVQLSADIDTHEILAIWRPNSSALPIKDDMTVALDLIESVLSGDRNNALAVMRTEEVKVEKRLVAALKTVHHIETGLEDLFFAHTFITTSLINQTWLDSVVINLAELLSAQWLEKIKLPAILRTPMITVPQIEQACNSSETGKKKIGQILLAAHQAISLKVPSDLLQQFRSWAE